MKTAALKPPPKPIRALIEWVQEQAAGWVWAHAEMGAKILRDAGPEWKEGLKRKEQLIKAAKKYAKKPLSMDDPKVLVHKVPLDLSGWNYPKPKELPPGLGVILHMTGEAPFGAANWMSMGQGKEPPSASLPTVGVMQVYADTTKLSGLGTPQDVHRAMHRLETAIEHEGRHLAQDLLAWATGVEQAGLGPGARERGEPAHPFEETEKYHLSPQEFHPLVDSMIREFRLKLKGVPAKRHRQKLKELMDNEPMLKTLEAKKPDWWRRAVKEITRQLLSDRVAARYAAEVLTKEWLMGVRRGWLSLMKPRITSWNDVMAAIDKLQSFVRNLRDQVLFIRRGPFTGLPDLPEHTKLKKILDAIEAEIKDARSRASYGKETAEGRSSLPGGWSQEEAEKSLRGWASDFEDSVSAGVSGTLTKMLDKALKLLREDAQIIRRHDEMWKGRGESFQPPEEAYKEFSLGRMKVVVNDRLVTADQIKKYVKYLDIGRTLLEKKGFGKAWHGEVFIECEKCGGENQYGAELGVGGHYRIGPDAIGIFTRPGKFVTELVIHELGHRWWFKNMSREGRLQFEEWIENGLAPVTSYGGKHFQEAFAEVFMHYVMDRPMTPQQVETFKLVALGRRFAAGYKGWTETKGETGRSIWTSPNGKAQILDALGRPGTQRYQVVYLQGGKRLEDIGWPSLKAAVDYVEGRRTLRDHPLHKRADVVRLFLARQVRVLIDRDKTTAAREKWPRLNENIVGTFDQSLALYRVFDEKELKHIASSGRITGGSYSVPAERSHGASWGHDISAIINMGNAARGGRLGKHIYLAKIDGLDYQFAHLSPGFDYDPNGPPKQPAQMNPSRCNPGLGCSIFVEAADVDQFYKVDPDGQIHALSQAELREEADKAEEDKVEAQPEPEYIREGFDLKPRDKFVITKGSKDLGVGIRNSGIVKDVWQRAEARKDRDYRVYVKLWFRYPITPFGRHKSDGILTLYAIHPNKLKEREFTLMDSRGNKVVVRKK